jgi:hypothetical protein
MREEYSLIRGANNFLPYKSDVVRTIEAMSRRLADLESLLLATQVRDRSNLPPPPVSSAPLVTSTRPPEAKMSISPYASITGVKREYAGRISADDSTEDDAPSPPGADHSLIDVNNETHGVEYYGGSSSVAILDRLYKRARRQSTNYRAHAAASSKPSVVNLLHNPEFHDLSPSDPHASPDGVYQSEPISSRLIEGGFLNAFFDTLHYMHPVVDKQAFLEKCDKGAVETVSDFAALYFACLAIAAITSPEKDPKLTGYSPIQWANMYVDRAKKGIVFEFAYTDPAALGDVFSVTTVETVQCLLLLVWPCFTFALTLGDRSTKRTPTARLLYVPRCSVEVCSSNWYARGVSANARSKSTTTDLVGYLFSRSVMSQLSETELSELCCASGRLNSLANDEDMTIAMPNMVISVSSVLIRGRGSA